MHFLGQLGIVASGHHLDLISMRSGQTLAQSVANCGMRRTEKDVSILDE